MVNEIDCNLAVGFLFLHCRCSLAIARTVPLLISFQKEERASAFSAADPVIDLLGLCLRIEVVDFDAQVFLKLTRLLQATFHLTAKAKARANRIGKELLPRCPSMATVHLFTHTTCHAPRPGSKTPWKQTNEKTSQTTKQRTRMESRNQ